jgi:hypothetical protein
MKRWMAVVALIAAACGGAGGGRRPDTSDSDPGDRGRDLYLDGKLDAAERELASVVARDPKNSFARRILGRIFLLKGRHRESAEQFLSYVTLARTEKTPVDGMAIQDLFWAFYRMDDYVNASKAAAMIDDSVFAVKYGEMAKRGSPYTSEWRDPPSVLSFEGAGSASVRINRMPGRFVLDFGQGEIVLDRAFAKDAGVRIVGVPSLDQVRDEQGIVESVDLPGLQVRNVPVVVSEVKAGADGILGVSFLCHLQATIDLRRNRAVLRPAGSPPREGGESLPMLFAGDRTLLAPARIDGIDTYVIVNPTARGVRFIPSQAMVLEKARLHKESPRLERVELGSLSVAVDVQTPEKFPPGVDVAYGFTIGGMLGADAFRGKSVTFDFKSMRITVE